MSYTKVKFGYSRCQQFIPPELSGLSMVAEPYGIWPENQVNSIVMWCENMEWPNKNDRQEFELNGFIDSYQKLSNGRVFSDIDKRDHKDRPDRIVQDVNTGELFGIELTSEYIDNRSVPDRHINDDGSTKPELLKIYEQRILDRIKEKVLKARSGYDLTYPLILSFYVNEYESIYMDEAYWRSFSVRNNVFFDHIEPFIEVVFWPLPNGFVVSAKSKKRDAYSGKGEILTPPPHTT